MVPKMVGQGGCRGEEGGTYIEDLSVEESVNATINMYLTRGRMWK